MGPRGGRWNPRFDFEEIVHRVASQVSEAEFASAIAVGEEFLGQCDYTPSRAEYHQVILAVLGVEASDALLDELERPIDPAEVVEPYDDVIPVLDELRRRGIRMAVVSDNWATLPELHASVGLGGYFEAYAISEVLGCNKPDPRMYRHASDALGLEPHACLFVDDHRPHVEAALALGYEAAVLARDEPADSSAVPTITSLVQLLDLLYR